MIKMRIKPTVGRAVLKVVIEEFPTTMLISGNTPEGLTAYKLYVEELADNDEVAKKFGIKIGDEVIVEQHAASNPDNKIVLSGNEFSFHAVHNMLKELSKEDTLKYRNEHPSLQVVEYMLVNIHDIRGIVTRL